MSIETTKAWGDRIRSVQKNLGQIAENAAPYAMCEDPSTWRDMKEIFELATEANDDLEALCVSDEQPQAEDRNGLSAQHASAVSEAETPFVTPKEPTQESGEEDKLYVPDEHKLPCDVYIHENFCFRKGVSLRTFVKAARRWFNDAAPRALTRPETSGTEARPLTADFTKSLPGGKLDDSTYQQIEDALDKIEAPMQDDNGRWLNLAERIAAIPLASPLPTVTKDYAGLIEVLRRHGEWLREQGHPLAAGFMDDAQQALLTLQQERDEARGIVAWANNSAFGSHSYFTEASAGRTLAEAIEDLKADCRHQYARAEALQQERDAWIAKWHQTETALVKAERSARMGFHEKHAALHSALTASQAEAEKLRAEVEQIEAACERSALDTGFAHGEPTRKELQERLDAIKAIARSALSNSENASATQEDGQ